MIEDENERGDDESKILVPTKIHIRGLDTLNTEEIKKYVAAHYGHVDRVEWIDDTGANLLFSSEASARDALIALSTIEIADPTVLAAGEETLPAKPFEAKPEISLHVRYAVASDKKAPGAALRSRFYLLNPEYDPEERRRKDKYRDRHGGRRGRRDSEGDIGISFEASMYDDAPRSSRDRDRPSSSPDRLRNRGKELFAGPRDSRRRDRDRSASPARSDESMSEEPSSSTNRLKARSLKSRISSDNRSKELFPSKRTLLSGGGQLDSLGDAMGSAHLREEDRPRIVESTGNFNIRGSAARGGSGDGGFAIKGASTARELFPGKFGGGNGNAGKELLDAKRRTRQRAEDLFG